MAKHNNSSWFKRICVNVLFCGWVSLAFHFHELHSNDLDRYHKPCQVCANASRIFQAVMPCQETRIPSNSILEESFLERQFSKISFNSFYSHDSRAPPLAENSI